MLHVLFAASLFTMSQVLSAPFVGDLTGSPDGAAIAFTANERGLHNVYFANGMTGAKRITAYSSDDGQVVGSLAIVPGDRAVIYVRGEGTNRRSEYPNPLSLPVPPAQTIWIVSASGSPPVRIGEGNSPVVSPKGDRVVWLLHGQPYSAALSVQNNVPRVGRPARLFSIRGSLSAPVFSPDGSRLAFTNSRGDHGFVAIYNLATRQLSYAAPYFASDFAPAWSADGKQIAFIRTPGTLEDEDPYVHYVKEPWSIWTTDADGSNGRQIWQADRGMGSEFYGTDSSAQLFWSRDGRVAFPWEKDGWRRLYSVSSQGGAAELLTPGAFEVENVTVSPDHSQLVFSSNQNDIDRRHIWSSGFQAGAPSQLTTGPDSQWTPVALVSGIVAYMDAGFKNPPAVYALHGGQAMAVGGPAVPAEFPANDLVEPQLVTFHAPDGLLIHAQVFVPQNDSGKHCAVIFDHGG